MLLGFILGVGAGIIITAILQVNKDDESMVDALLNDNVELMNKNIELREKLQKYEVEDDIDSHIPRLD